MKKIRVQLVDDHAVVRAGIRFLLERQPDMEVVGEAANAEQAIPMAGQLRPDIILLDLSLPGLPGIDAIAPLRAASPQSRVLILSMHDDRVRMRLALLAGATGYMSKRAEDAELLSTIRRVAEESLSDTPISAPDTSSAPPQSGQPTHIQSLQQLSPRERQVLTLVASGHSNREVAAHLGLGIKSAETYRRRLVKKLGFSSRAELVRFALQAGLISGRKEL